MLQLVKVNIPENILGRPVLVQCFVFACFLVFWQPIIFVSIQMFTICAILAALWAEYIELAGTDVTSSFILNPIVLNTLVTGLDLDGQCAAPARFAV